MRWERWGDSVGSCHEGAEVYGIGGQRCAVSAPLPNPAAERKALLWRFHVQGLVQTERGGGDVCMGIARTGEVSWYYMLGRYPYGCEEGTWLVSCVTGDRWAGDGGGITPSPTYWATPLQRYDNQGKGTVTTENFAQETQPAAPVDEEVYDFQLTPEGALLARRKGLGWQVLFRDLPCDGVRAVVGWRDSRARVRFDEGAVCDAGELALVHTSAGPRRCPASRLAGQPVPPSRHEPHFTLGEDRGPEAALKERCHAILRRAQQREASRRDGHLEQPGDVGSDAPGCGAAR